MRCLVDTGSSNTIMTRGVLKKLYDGERTLQVKVCNCKLITLGGPCGVEGEVEIGLRRWAAKGGKLTVHVVGEMPREYQVIIGCDMLGKVGVRIAYRREEWKIKMGRIRYTSTMAIEGHEDRRARVGAISRAEDWRVVVRREFEDIFFKEGDTLGVTGKTVHEIPLKREKVSYVKERRYPQALRQYIREELESLKKQEIIVDSTSPYNSPLWAVKKKGAPGEE